MDSATRIMTQIFQCKIFMIEIYSKIEKTSMSDMPKVTFDGIIEEIDTIEKAEEAIEKLSKEKIVGFDTETKPSFVKGVNHKVALLQFSTERTAYLFRLNIIGIPKCIADFLSDSKIIKVGIAVRDDFNSLGSRSRVTPAGFVDLTDLSGEIGIEEKGLQKIYAILFSRKISKSQQLSNWEAESLTEGQRQYAAIDAWACLKIYTYLSKLKKNGKYRIVRNDAEESNT